MYTKKTQLYYKSLKTLHQKAWDLQSEYIRRIERGICYTCGKMDDWKEMDAGHCVHGNSVDFADFNIHCQCSRCNRWLHGNPEIYIGKVIKNYGLKEYEKILKQKQNGHKFKVKELEQIILKYRELLKLLKN